MPERAFTTITQEPIRWNIPEDFEGIIAYNPRHDIQDYLDLKNLEGRIPQVQYAELLIQTNNRTRRNLEKALGERLAVEKSTFHYFLDETGELWSENYAEPAVAHWEKGQRFLEENGSSEVEREKAEVAGIKKVRNILAQNRDVTLVIASPRAENCKHGEEENPKDEDEDILYHANYFDVYVQQGRIVTVTRYHSTHSYPGFLNALCQIDPNYQRPQKGQPLNPAYMLSRPAETAVPLTQILEKFALDKKAKSTDIELKATEDCMPYILSYITTLIENPLDIKRIKLTWNTIANTFDESVESIELAKHKKAFAQFLASRPIPQFSQNIEAYIQFKGREPVRTVSGGPCPGKQKGFSLSSALARLARTIGATSVADFSPFGSDGDEEVVDFQCPGKKKDGTRCTHIVRAYSHETTCPECGTEATCL